MNKIKLRKTWAINPKERIVESKKKKSRNTSNKQEERDILDEALEDLQMGGA